ncbi:MAG: tail fiber domain-containing protein [Sutterella wadsworthensis]
MSVQNITRRAGPYVGTGLVSAYTFAFKVFRSEDVKVVRSASSDANAQDETLTLGTDYTVKLNADQNEKAGGTVTLVFPLAEGLRLSILSAITPDQQMVLTNHDGMLPTTLNDSADKAIALIQELQELLGRGITVPATSGMSPEELLGSLLDAAKDAQFSAEEAKRFAEICEEIKQNIFIYSWDIPHVVDTLDDVEKYPYDGFFAVGGYGDPGHHGQDISNRVVKARGSTELRTLGERFADVVNVKDFGAKGDGVADDTAAIQAAIATRKSVFFPEPKAFYNITDEIGPKWPGQKLFANSKVRGMIRNVTNDRRLAIIGDPLRADGAAPQAGLINLCFYGNPLSTGGIVLATNLNAGNPDWSDASKDCVIDHCAVDYVGHGWALEVYSWCNTISDFTCYEGNLKGCLYADSANQNTSLGLYLTGCTEQSLQIGGDGSQRRNRGNLFAGLVVQQSGGSVGCVTIADADNTVITSLYSERNKSSSCVVHIDATATGTCINGASHLSGGAVVIQNEGKNTTVTSVVSSNVTGAIVENKGNGSIVSHSIDWLPDVVPTGVKFSDRSTAKSGVYFDSVGFGDLKLRNYAPSIEFEDMSASQKKLRIKVDQGVLRAEYDAAGDGKYSQLLFAINSAVPEMNIDGMVRPNTDGSRNLGTGSRRWANIYASTGTINTSDAREKTAVASPDDALMRAWSKVNFKVFQFKDAVEKKGADARLHVGVIAQQVIEAFKSEGLDATRYGLLCYDKWEDEYEDVEVIDVPEVADEEGNIVTPQKTHVEHRLVTPAGDRYGIRYEEALALEAAYLRWELQKIKQNQWCA